MRPEDGEARPPGEPGDIRLSAPVDRRRAEALALELRALAQRFGLDVAELRIETTPSAGPPPAESAAPPATPSP